ncbi:hypothetical protein C9374_005977 [Naegleria lovaniensis]|uniref:EF-hand domain-containing protein n=1 Tax=Naegleria lovaniensis TaxID=51637 RepID=A0AA88GN24_NAELO|nr:uncharacterized protein C9374_005977 [Naegleria lovaniensis]KAG2381593.1 hypothetical protein C9374_005977 [Naegleria lovaniensis]
MDLDRLTQESSASSSSPTPSSSPNNIGFSSPKTKETDSPSELNQYAKQKLNELYLYWLGQQESQNLMYQYTDSFSNAILSSSPPLENHNGNSMDESLSSSSQQQTSSSNSSANTNFNATTDNIIGGYDQHTERKNPIMPMEELAHHPSTISLSHIKSSSPHNAAELLSFQRQNLNSSLHDRHTLLMGCGDNRSSSLKSNANPFHSPPHPHQQQQPQRSPHSSPKIFSSAPRSSSSPSTSKSSSTASQVLVDEVDFSVSSIQHKLSTHENHHHHSSHPHPASSTVNNNDPPCTTTLHDPYGNVVSISSSLQHVTPHSYNSSVSLPTASTSCSTPPKSPLHSPTRSHKPAVHLETEPLQFNSSARRKLNFSDELELGISSDPTGHKTGLLQRKLQELQNVASNYESQKKKMKMSVDEASFSQIPRFYFPNEKSQTSEKLKQDIYKIKSFFLDHPSGVALEHFGKVVTDICEMPSFFKSHIFMRIDELGTGSVTCEMFEEYYRKHLQFDNESYRYFNVIKQQKNDFIIPQDFEIIMRELLAVHPGLRFLESTPDFQEKYLETVIIRIFYTLNRSGNGRISLRELKNSPLVDAFKLLDREQDTNNEINFFAYEHFYVLYCKFWELDTDRDGMLSKEDLMAYGDNCLTEFIVDRIMGGNGKKLTAKLPGMMSYEDFIWFCLSEEDKTTPVAQEYWFRCVDIDGDGVLSLYELEQVFAEQKERIKQYDPEISFNDVHCQIIDMLKPKNRDAITLSDVKRSKMSPVFFNILFNLTKFWLVEQKGTLGTTSSNVWAQYAKEEYQRLISEDEEEQAVDMVDDEEMDKDDLVDEKEAWEL